MKPFIQIQLNTGHVYEVPTEAIVQNRAAYYHAERAAEFPTLQDAIDDTRGLFDDATEIKEWAANNMNWDELLPVAKLVRYSPPEVQAWNEGEWTYHDHQALLSELDGETLMGQPVELVLHTMAAHRQLCNITLMNGSDGKACAALALIIGSEPVLSSYLSGLNYISEQLAAMAAGGAAPEQAPTTTH